MSASYFNSISRINKVNIETYIDAPDSIYGTGMDGDATLDGSSTVLGMIPVSSVYSMTSDLYFNNLTINSGVRLSPNGYRIFVKNILTFAGDNATIGFTTGYSTSGSIKQGGEIATAVTHSLGGASATTAASLPLSIYGGSEYFKVPHQAVTGYSLTSANAGGEPAWLRGGAGGLLQPGGGIVVIAARYITGPSSGTGYIKAPATPPAGGGVILIVSSAASLPESVTTDVTGQNAGTVNYMQLV